MNSSKKYLYVGVVALLLVIGVSLAYFGITIIGNDTAKGNKVVTGNLELTYTDTTEISLENAFPGDSFEKTISVKNTGTKEVSYNLVWTELTNEITNNELVIEATCKRLNSSGTEEGTCEAIAQTPVSNNTIKKNISIEVGTTHEYTVKVTFIDTGKLQDYNKNKSFTGKLGINEYKSNSPAPTYCTYDGELTQGAEYVNGQYTYRYMQESSIDDSSDDTVWKNINNDGWGVVLTDKTSTDPVISTLCTYINNKPVVSMSLMFMESQATSINLGSFNTENVTNMYAMFAAAQATTLDVSNLDTSNVTDMSNMFAGSQATTLDLSDFDTSKVTNMQYMFAGSQATSINISTLNTSNVTDMSSMFTESMVTSLDFSSFDTSNVTTMKEMICAPLLTNLTGIENFNTSKVTDMSGMFAAIKISNINLDLSNFNTSNVTDMSNMFGGANIASLNLNGFDTSKVTDMSSMFNNSQIKSLNISSFDTSKVVSMSMMFYSSRIPNLNLSNFNTSNVTSMDDMFNDIELTEIDLSSFDTSKVTDMFEMFYNSSKLEKIIVSESFVTNNVTSSDSMFTGCTALVGGAGTKFDSTKIDKTYARIDGGTSRPGYFTAK